MPAAPHLRAQIRGAAVSALSGLTTTGARVWASRMRPRKADALPCLLVATNDERIEPENINSALERTLSLVVTGHAMGADLDDTLDQIALEVEAAIAADPTLGGLCNCFLSEVHVDLDDSLEMPAGSIALDFRTVYYTAAATPGAVF